MTAGVNVLLSSSLDVPAIAPFHGITNMMSTPLPEQIWIQAVTKKHRNVGKVWCQNDKEARRPEDRKMYSAKSGSRMLLTCQQFFQCSVASNHGAKLPFLRNRRLTKRSSSASCRGTVSEFPAADAQQVRLPMLHGSL